MPHPDALERITLRDQAERSLRELIAAGELAPGERVNEVAVAARLGISRGPLREAIQGLAREGLLELITHRGAFVRTVDAGQLRELYELRIALEAYAAKRLAGMPRSAGVDALGPLLAAAESEVLHTGGYPSDADFHRGLVAALSNGSLSAAADDVQQRISIARARSARHPERAVQALTEHREILRAINGGRVDDAGRLMEQHLWASYEHAVETLQP